MEDRQYDFLKHAHTVLNDIASKGKAHMAWELRQEEIEMMEDGKKVKKIREFLA